jgi:uncharacterized alkaline shock family protein YloU
MAEPSESVHSAVVRAEISHAVIASYVVDAINGSDGVAALSGSRPVRIINTGDEDGLVDVDVRLVLAEDASCPETSRTINTAVRRYLESMVAVRVRRLTVLVEDVADA